MNFRAAWFCGHTLIDHLIAAIEATAQKTQQAVNKAAQPLIEVDRGLNYGLVSVLDSQYVSACCNLLA